MRSTTLSVSILAIYPLKELVTVWQKELRQTRKSQTEQARLHPDVHNNLCLSIPGGPCSRQHLQISSDLASPWAEWWWALHPQQVVLSCTAISPAFSSDAQV